MYEVYFKKTSTDLLQTECKVKGCKVGGYYCVNCIHFGGKSIQKQRVKCSLNHDLKQ